MIVFVGDSFCSDYAGDIEKQHQTVIPNIISWMSEVGSKFKSDISVHGYGGRDWWYSWSKFQDEWQNNMHEIDTIVFCHTSESRIHNSWNDDLIALAQPSNDKKAKEIVETYYKHIYDRTFHKFAQLRYFKMLQEWSLTIQHIKTIHFTCFGHDHDMLATLPGTVFTTPLQHIAIGGLTGTKKEIVESLTAHNPERLHNHFTKHNNIELGRQTALAIKHYEPGLRSLDMSKFKLPNPNYKNWPDGHWATK